MKDPGKYDAEIMKFGEYGKWIEIAWSCRTYWDHQHSGNISFLEIKIMLTFGIGFITIKCSCK